MTGKATLPATQDSKTVEITIPEGRQERGSGASLSHRRRLGQFVSAFLGLFMVATAFAALTPLSASPDEPDHWRQAYAVWDGQVSPFEDVSTYDIPRYLMGYPAQCTYQQPRVTAVCATPISLDTTPVEGASSARTMPWVHYIATGWVTQLVDGKAAVYGMRVASACFFALLGATAILLLRPTVPRWRSHASILLGFTPAIFFLGGTMNPNATEVAAVVLLAVVSWRWVTSTESDLQRRWALATIGIGILCAGVRPLSGLFAAIAISAVAVCAPRTVVYRKRVMGPLLVAGGLILLQIAIAFRYSIFATLTGLFSSSDTGVDAGTTASQPAEAWQPYLIRSLWLGTGSAANWTSQMGWLDAGTNSISTAAWFSAIGLVVLAALDRVPRRAIIAAGAVLLVLVVIWLVLDNVYSRSGGVPFWQSRYGAALIAIAILSIGLWVGPSAETNRSRRLLYTAATVMALAVITAAVVLLVRYGWGPDWKGPIYEPSWLPMRGNRLLILLVLGASAAGMALVAVGPPLLGSRRAASSRGEFQAEDQDATPRPEDAAGQVVSNTT